MCDSAPIFSWFWFCGADSGNKGNSGNTSFTTVCTCVSFVDSVVALCRSIYKSRSIIEGDIPIPCNHWSAVQYLLSFRQGGGVHLYVDLINNWPGVFIKWSASIGGLVRLFESIAKFQMALAGRLVKKIINKSYDIQIIIQSMIISQWGPVELISLCLRLSACMYLSPVVCIYFWQLFVRPIEFKWTEVVIFKYFFNKRP